MTGTKGTLYMRGVLLSFNIISRFSIFLSLATYVYCGNVFTAKQVFIVTAYFNYLYDSMLHFFPLSLGSLAESYVSVKRVEDFLLEPERKEVGKTTSDGETEIDALINRSNRFASSYASKLSVHKYTSKLSVRNQKFASQSMESRRGHVNEPETRKGVMFKDASAYWSSAGGEGIGTSGVENLNLIADADNLCAIIGSVGAGKSTILHIILGELDLDDGYILINGAVSYASQEPWLFEGTVRQNILFTEEYDEER